MTLPVVFTANGPSGYNLTNSLRFRSSASAYLNRTPASATNRQTWTWSSWMKRGSLDSWQIFFGAWDGAGGNDTTRLDLAFEAANTISITGGVTVFRNSTQVFRDPSAWYHIVVVADTTNATAQNRLRIYVNGVEITSWGTNNTVTQNTSLAVDNNASHVIGARGNSPTQYFDGYMTEINFIDGQALTPSSFGETSTTTGVWQPIKYAGTYGTNGFYLPFTDVATTSGSNAGLGKDFSGNANYWTTNNISVTSGSTYDSMTDVPTNTDTNTANYCVLNPLKSNSSTSTYQNGNLQVTFPSGSAGGIATGTIAISLGKFYWEVTVGGTDGSTQPKLGIISPTVQTETSSSIDVGDLGYAYVRNGNKSILGSVSAYGSSFTTGDVIGFALDMDAGTLVCYKNNTSQGTLVSGLSGQFTAGLTAYNGYSETINFGQRPFAYTPPTGFKALNTFNLPTPTIGATASTLANEYFDATLYTGNSTTNNIVNAGGMQPDFVWIKSRSNNQGNNLFDSVRGAGYVLFSNATNAETNNTANFTSFNSNGFSLASNGGDTNLSGYTYVGWQWRASNATAVTNTAGSITSTVSANTTAGFSIATFTGNGTSGATIGHGLGVAPSMAIIKMRSAVQNWTVYHASLGNTKALSLDLTDAASTTALFWNNTSPTSSLITLGSGNGVNKNTETYVAYCFAPVAGYSAFGSYTGNGSTDGTFVYTGFRPKFVLMKATSGSNNWIIYDTVRNTYNLTNLSLVPDSSAPENGVSTTTENTLDILSNGFKLKTSNALTNGSSVTYIYMAFAENPFKYSLAR